MPGPGRLRLVKVPLSFREAFEFVITTSGEMSPFQSGNRGQGRSGRELAQRTSGERAETVGYSRRLQAFFVLGGTEGS